MVKTNLFNYFANNWLRDVFIILKIKKVPHENFNMQ